EIEGILPAPRGPRVLTPHPGEYSRLTGERVGRSDDDRATGAVALASQDPAGQITVVLKGHRSVVADAERYAFNTTGNPGMATGGMGDVLTGVIAGLLAQGMTAWEAARLGTHLHGLAGDLAATMLGEI